jgi:uncharacterized alpha-E superfamily protein
MLSRVADSIYWLNRYIERAENVARFVDVNLNLLLDISNVLQAQWDPLIITTGDKAFFHQHYGQANAENVMDFLTFNQEYPNSIVSCVYKARDNARSIRDTISSEMWEQVNAFYSMVRGLSQLESLADMAAFLAEVKQASHLFAGIMDSTMAHNEGWHFGYMGRLMERADKTSRILDVKYFLLLPQPEDVGTPIDEVGWMALLRSASAYEMYRKRSTQHRITPAGVAEFLILDQEFPRSIQFCLSQTQKSLHLITGTPLGNWQSPVERSLGRLRAELEYLTIDEIIQAGMHEFLDGLQSKMNGVDEAIATHFFTLAQATQSQSQVQSQLQSQSQHQSTVSSGS